MATIKKKRILIIVCAVAVLVGAIFACVYFITNNDIPNKSNQEYGVERVGDTNGTYPVMTEIINGKRFIYYCILCEKMFEGDIILDGSCCNHTNNTNVRRRLNPLLSNRNSYWKNGYIPYEIDEHLPDKNRVTEAVNHWNSRTKIRLGDRENEINFVKFVSGEVCSSSVGMKGGQQNISLDPGCDVGAAIHEIGHTLGMFHTQSREDRDRYIQILTDNIIEGYEFNFVLQNEAADDCLKYAYNSIMHYPSNAFAKEGTITIRTINPPNAEIGNRNGLSMLDIACVNAKYSLCRVALFQNDNFEGQEYSPFGTESYSKIKQYTDTDLMNLEFKNDEVSSMKIDVDPNAWCRVILFQHADYSGWQTDIIADNTQNEYSTTFTYTLSQLQKNRFVENAMSSMWIKAESSCEVTFYKNDFTNRDEAEEFAKYPIGDYTFNHLETINFINDEASSLSIWVKANEQCQVDLFGAWRFSGWKATVTFPEQKTNQDTGKIYTLWELERLGFKDNELSSFKIYTVDEDVQESNIKSYNNQCLQIDPTDYTNKKTGGLVQIWDCNGQENQMFRIEPKKSKDCEDCIQIKSLNGMCLEISESDWHWTPDGAKVRSAECIDEDNKGTRQLWFIEESYWIKMYWKENCLDENRNQYNEKKNGGEVTIRKCDEHRIANQKWYFGTGWREAAKTEGIHYIEDVFMDTAGISRDLSPNNNSMIFWVVVTFFICSLSINMYCTYKCIISNCNGKTKIDQFNNDIV
eukprot:32139_1